MQIEPFEAEQNKQKVAIWMSRESVSRQQLLTSRL